MGSTAPLTAPGAASDDAQRLGQLVRRVIVDDCVVQALVVLAWLTVLRSPWLVALWAARWMVVLADVLSLRAADAGRHGQALTRLLVGHVITAWASAAVLPEFAALTVLVLVGDLMLLVPLGSPQVARRLAVGLVAAMAVVGLLSLQDWTGLADEAPLWLVVGFAVVHVVGTARSMRDGARSVARTLLDEADRVTATRRAVSRAADRAAATVRGSLRAGPMADLDDVGGAAVRLAAGLHDGADPVVARGQVDATLADGQRALQALREISHGMRTAEEPTDGDVTGDSPLVDPGGGGPPDDVADEGVLPLLAHRRRYAWLTVGGGALALVLWTLTRSSAFAATAAVLAVAVLPDLLAGRALRVGRRTAAAWWSGTQHWTVAVGVSVAIPPLAPAMVAVASLPVILAPPRLPSPVLRAMAVVQTMVAGVCLLVPVLGLDGAGWIGPPWAAVVGVPLACAALAGLVAMTVLGEQQRLQALVHDRTVSLRDLRAAVARERRRIERDLHDGAQQHVVAVILHLRAAGVLLGRGLVAPAAGELGHAAGQAQVARATLESLAAGAFPTALLDGDLGAAVRSAAAASVVPTAVEVVGDVRVPAAAGSAVYFSCVEALQNVAKHAGTGVTASVRVVRADGWLEMEVRDDGCGFDPASGALLAGSGLAHIGDRAAEVGGTWRLDSAPGRGCAVVVRVPVASATAG